MYSAADRTTGSTDGEDGTDMVTAHELTLSNHKKFKGISF
jgi:hypothetical protein